MKLLRTITEIVEEAETNYYTASIETNDPKELEVLESKLNDSLRLLEIYKGIKKED
jgi:spore coat protein CotF|tara:strand:+ start:81 stop:248 length:168 start_codon:yes stop_codon:yes gene_type:complete